MDYRLELAEKVGADVVINVSKEDVVKRVMEITDGRGVDVVFEVSGSEKSFKDALRIVRPGGSIVQIGIFEKEEISFDPALLVDKELTIFGVFRYANVYEPAIRLVSAGKIKLKPLITHRFPLENIKEAFEVILKREGNPVKVIVTP